MRAEKTVLIVGLLFSLVGVVMLTGSIYIISKTYYFFSTGLKAQGQVTEINGSDRGAYPTVQFYNQKGELLLFIVEVQALLPLFL